MEGSRLKRDRQRTSELTKSGDAGGGVGDSPTQTAVLVVGNMLVCAACEARLWGLFPAVLFSPFDGTGGVDPGSVGRVRGVLAQGTVPGIFPVPPGCDKVSGLHC